jgi:23S rRNA pseudouridine2605 synthase
MGIRLQKYIADSGVTSRRKAEELMAQGRVQVNGIRVTEMGTKVNPSEDVVSVDGATIDPKSVDKVYILLNKPRGYVTTVEDPEGRKTVMDLVKMIPERIYPVGRLDYLSEGLLLMTNDGELANSIIHPSSNINKVYEVKVFGAVTEALLMKLRKGVEIEGYFMKPKSVRVVKQLPKKTWLEFRLTEGRNREIRKICEAHGLTVDKLKRVAIGGLGIEGLAPGRSVSLTKKQLLSEIGLDESGVLIEQKEFWSGKKTINIKKKGPQVFVPADDTTFQKFRKDTYFETLKGIADKKIAEKERETEEYFAGRKELMDKRKKRDRRLEKKRLAKTGGAHAEFVK